MTEDTDKVQPPALILFGSPGSGKGTQAKLLRDRFSWPHISTGDMLRSHIAAGDQIGREIQQLMRSGKLVPDELVNRLVQRRLADPDCRHGVILDGYPRTLRQAGVLLGIMEHYDFRPAVVHLEVDHARIVARLSGRRLCPVCGTLYSVKTHPPKVSGICDLDGTPLITREDDKESVIRERLDQYEHETRPLLEYFRKSGVVMIATQGASRSPEEIMKATVESLSAAGLLPVELIPDANVVK